MELSKYIKQLENQELCAKWNNNIPLDEFAFPEFIITDLSQEINSLCESFDFLPCQKITGYICTVLDGDYGEVYVTESRSPWILGAIYHPLSYYL